ncbi:aldehyde dehydrogenase [Acrasis kona]|uniref:Aldehyde dehydrogenase n=1 Tax=Acrasis kona TaxID=1008807 RepID=A0AAW2YKV9_9EUKA
MPDATNDTEKEVNGGQAVADEKVATKDNADLSTDYKEIVKELRKSHRSGANRNASDRAHNLNQLKKMLIENKEALKEAQVKDLRQNDLIQKAEIHGPLDEINYLLENFESWMRPIDAQPRALSNAPSRGKLVYEPLGVVLIISPWNYPISLVIKPLAGALSAGCVCIVKPSELSANVSKLLSELISKYLDPQVVRVVQGAVLETTTLLESCRFDHIFYTGSTNVGKIIMQHAARNLTPVCLELGGKSPCYVDAELNIEVAARRLVWSKFLNNGQTCVAPDYLLLNKKVSEPFLELFKSEITKQFGENIKASADYSRIISERHTERISALIEPYRGTDKLIFGGSVDVSDKFVEPTIILNPNPKSAVMTDEIFGPVLPVVLVDDEDQAIEFILEGEKPLALYVFSTNNELGDKFSMLTSSGAVVTNDCIGHFNESVLPFGGVGQSGIGNYNGKFSFETFSHLKTIMNKASWTDPPLRYTPRSDKATKLLDDSFEGKYNFTTPLLNLANMLMRNK